MLLSPLIRTGSGFRVPVYILHVCTVEMESRPLLPAPMVARALSSNSVLGRYALYCRANHTCGAGALLLGIP